LKADGVTLFTRYGDGNYYLGHEKFKPIWDELDKRAAVVFIHPTHPVDITPVNKLLAQPIIDYPHETTRTAVDLIVSDTIRTHRNVKIILSHAGGTHPG
jgi:predicted TIM-barrel fold metal-dependent hydrolase